MPPTDAETRRRNVRLVTEVEEALEQVDGAVLEIVLSAHRLWTDLHGMRAKLRTALGLAEAYDPPPLIEKIRAAAVGEPAPEPEETKT